MLLSNISLLAIVQTLAENNSRCLVLVFFTYYAFPTDLVENGGRGGGRQEIKEPQGIFFLFIIVYYKKKDENTNKFWREKKEVSRKDNKRGGIGTR